MFWNAKLRLMLMVYVDDFKMSGPTKNLPEGWKLLRSGIDMDDPYPLDRCLGCIHHIRAGMINQKPVQIIEYDVCDFMQQCVQAYKNACGEPDMQLRKVDTPFLPSPEGGICAGASSGRRTHRSITINCMLYLNEDSLRGACCAMGSIENHAATGHSGNEMEQGVRQGAPQTRLLH